MRKELAEGRRETGKLKQTNKQRMVNRIGGFVPFFHFPVPNFNNVHCFFLRRPRDAPWTEKEKFISVCLFSSPPNNASHKKISRRGRVGTAERNVPKSVLHMQNLLFNFLNFNLFYVVFAAIAVIVAKCRTVLSMCVFRCWESEYVFSIAK